MKFFIGIDVGTSSVRAGLFNERGELTDSRVEPITVHNTRADFYEQSSDEIWTAVCECVRHLQHLHTDADIVSIGFDATCSLVVLDDAFRPVSISPSNDSSLNVIMWMDHRAKDEGFDCENVSFDVYDLFTVIYFYSRLY